MCLDGCFVLRDICNIELMLVTFGNTDDFISD